MFNAYNSFCEPHITGKFGDNFFQNWLSYSKNFRMELQ